MFAVQDPAAVREAAERLDGVLADLDLGLLLPSSLKDLVALGDRIERLGHGLKTRAAAKVAQSQVWRGEGDRSPEDWLARQTGTSAAEAGRLVDTGRKLDHAKAKTLRELQDECRRTRANAEADPEAAQRRAHAKRSCRTWTDADGITGHVHMTGPVANIARLDNAIRHRADQTFRVARAEGRREPSEAYAFDAAEALLTGAGDGTAAPAGADAKIIVRVDHTALVRGRTVDGETCEIAGVGPVPVGTVREWMDDAFLAAVLTKGEVVHTVVHLGRRFRAAQRTALQWQDPVCARQGCSNRLRLEYDHFEDWADTHTTRVEAGKRFCSSCHRLKSTGWQVSAPDAEGQCTFTSSERLSVAEACAAAVKSIRSRGPDMRLPAVSDTG